MHQLVASLIMYLTSRSRLLQSISPLETYWSFWHIRANRLWFFFVSSIIVLCECYTTSVTIPIIALKNSEFVKNFPSSGPTLWRISTNFLWPVLMMKGPKTTFWIRLPHRNPAFCMKKKNRPPCTFLQYRGKRARGSVFFFHAKGIIPMRKP